jgi:ribosomal protein S18 acetylase RimI-like enzyme
VRSVNEWSVREYRHSDEQSWLRCRVLGFLDTAYFDDVWTSKPRREPGLELVATIDGQVVGLVDASVDGPQGTIETIVVHPDHRRSGIGRALLAKICSELARRGATEVNAWTRDDPGTLAWYRSEGFSLRLRYLHVFANSPEEMANAVSARAGLLPRTGHFHAWLEDERELRSAFSRVHSCHRYVRPIAEVPAHHMTHEP